MGLETACLSDGDKPAEDVNEMLVESERVFARMLELISAINRTNAGTRFDANRTTSDAIAERDLIGKMRDSLSGVAEAASTRQDRYSKSEIRFMGARLVSFAS